MKKFLAIYTGTPAGREKWNALDQTKRKEREQAGMKAWHEWGAKHQKVILDMGGPLGKTKRAAPEGISDIKNQMTGYVVIQAESHDAAARMFEKHPHFTLFPGDSVEIMEILPVPGQ